MISCVLLAIVTLLSTGVISDCLESSLEIGYGDDQRCPSNAVVVLSGGYSSGERDGDDRLAGESVLRVMKGVDVLNRCATKWIIMSGSSTGGSRGRDGELMRDFAIRLGVPKDHIRLEMESSNTREHVTGLKGLEWFGGDAELAVVTSPWHLRRTMMEFSRAFPRAYPVMAYSRSQCDINSLREWIPRIDALYRSTVMLHEYIGCAWQGILARIQRTT